MAGHQDLLLNMYKGLCSVLTLFIFHVPSLSSLSKAAEESEKTTNVDIRSMMVNSALCQELVNRMELEETDDTILAALDQLKVTLQHHQQVLGAKISQLDGAGDAKPAAFLLPQSQNATAAATPGPGISDTDESGSSQSSNTVKDKRRSAVEATIIKKGGVRFESVAGLREAKQTLKEAVIIPLQFPHLFTGGRKPWKRILLYGPPGTGKSFLARAVSSEIVNSTFYCVSSSDLVSSWVGESEKLIKELFYHATHQDGRSVIFIDEIDSICRKRSSREEEYTRRIKTELLRQMEGADNQKLTEKIFVLCATNCPWELDSAFLRRFQKRIYIPLPDDVARIKIMKIHTKENNLHLTSEEWRLLADMTKGFSGSDIAAATNGALFEPIRDLQKARYWKEIDEKYVPCNKGEVGRIEASMVDLPPLKVQPRGINADDFKRSFTSYGTTVTKEELKRFEEFTENYGISG
ncbi:uncharacterized protein LOC135496560 [Lineus longissimus]|uniref:uncharacterized protein LOC135496560 n=1 Tax=Lineus longissimus TaxID=88925 RepID=UPI00315C8DD2